VSDVEATDNVLYVFNKQDAFPEEANSSPEYLIFSYINMMCSQMIDVRFQEITKKKDSPFVYASAGSEEFFISKTKDAWTSYAQTKDGKIEEALRVLLQETKRAKNFGFTQTEYDRVRADFFKELENAYQE
jgi:zinc protease